MPIVSDAANWKEELKNAEITRKLTYFHVPITTSKRLPSLHNQNTLRPKCQYSW